jgi:serine/threonine protein kinase
LVGMSSNLPYPAGTVITGKWRGNRYVVERMLGKGANGTVYLVQREGRRGRYALKIGYDTLELQSEINVLTSLQSCRKRSEHRARKESPLSSYLLESDDFKDRDHTPFYVMRYVEGRPLHHFLSRNGASWLGLVGMKLLEKLQTLHECGFVFGDLKPENVMVSNFPVHYQLRKSGEVRYTEHGRRGRRRWPLHAGSKMLLRCLYLCWLLRSIGYSAFEIIHTAGMPDIPEQDMQVICKKGRRIWNT